MEGNIHHAVKNMKKGISFWSLAEGSTVKEGLRIARDAGFDGVELLFVENGLWGVDAPNAEKEVRKMAEDAGIELASITLGPGWFKSMLTSSVPFLREKAKDNIRRMLESAEKLGIDTILAVCGAMELSWLPKDSGACRDFLPYDKAYEAALSAFKELSVFAEKAKITIGIENISSKFLLSPLEMRDFVDKVGSPYVQCFFDVGNVPSIGNPVDWIKILGKRIKRVHVKDYRNAAGDAGYCDLLAGDINWPSVMSAFEEIKYDGYIIAEMMPVYQYYPDQLIYNTYASLSRILAKK